MRVPFKRSKSYKSDVQSETEQSPKTPTSTSHPREQPDSSKRRRLVRKQINTNVQPAEQPLNTPSSADTWKSDDNSSKRQMVSRVATQWRKTTQKKMGLSRKTTPENDPTSQYQTILDASDLDAELNAAQSGQDVAQDQSGGEAARPRDSAVPSEFHLKAEHEKDFQTDPVAAVGQVTEIPSSNVKQSEVTITSIPTDEQINQNDNNKPVTDVVAASDEAVVEADPVDIVRDAHDPDAPSSMAIPIPIPRRDSETPGNSVTEDTNIVPPSRTPSPLMFCKRSLPRSSKRNFSQPTDSSQGVRSRASSIQDEATAQGTPEAGTPCPARVVELPFVGPRGGTTQAGDINTQEDEHDNDYASELLSQPENISDEEEVNPWATEGLTSPDSVRPEAETVSEAAANTAEADANDHESGDALFQIEIIEATTPDVHPTNVEAVVEVVNESKENQHESRPNATPRVELTTTDENNENNDDEQDTIMIEEIEIRPLKEEGTRDEESRTDGPEHTVDTNAAAHAEPEEIEQDNEPHDILEASNPALGIAVIDPEGSQSQPLDIPSTPGSPAHISLNDTLARMNDVVPNSPTGTFSASGSFPPNSFPPLSASFPEHLARSVSPDEEPPQVTPSTSAVAPRSISTRSSVDDLNAAVSATEGYADQPEPLPAPGATSPHNSVRRRRPHPVDQDVAHDHAEQGSEACAAHAAETPTPKQRAKETWGHWTMKWLTGCTCKRNLLRLHMLLLEVERAALLCEARGLEIEMQVLEPAGQLRRCGGGSHKGGRWMDE